MLRETSDFEPASGWEDECVNPNDDLRLIEIANSLVSLDSILKRYKVDLEPTYSGTDWSMRCSCPFSDHNDRTPSFGYNKKAGRFNCFGCHRGGKAVEFIAYKDHRTKLSVAKEIVGQHSTEEVLLHNSNFDFEKLQLALFDFADTVRKFVEHNKSIEANKYARNVTWSLDVYLQKYAPRNAIVLDELKARIALLKEQLELYGDE